MRKNYDLKELKWKANPYAKLLKKPINIRFDQDVIDYFKAMAENEGMPYQTLINLFLRYCKEEQLKPKTKWAKNSA